MRLAHLPAQPRGEHERGVSAPGADDGFAAIAFGLLGIEFAEVAVAEGIESAGERKGLTPPITVAGHGLTERRLRRRWARFPFAAGVEHLDDAAPGKARP